MRSLSLSLIAAVLLLGACRTAPKEPAIDVAALHDVMKKSPEDQGAFLKRAIAKGRLAALRGGDSAATLALVAAHIPETLDAADALAADGAATMKQIEKQSGPRTAKDGQVDDHYLDLTTAGYDLAMAIHDLPEIPADLEGPLRARADSTGTARRFVFDLMAKLALPAERRCWILLAYIVPGDDDAANGALGALKLMGTEASPALTELRQREADLDKNPDTRVLAKAVRETIRRIERTGR